MKTLCAGFVVSMSLALIASGCSSPAGDTGTTSDDLSIAQRITGSFEEVGKNTVDLPYYAYTFKADGTWTAQGGCRQSGPGPHCFAITEGNGTYKLKRSSKGEEIVFTNAANETSTYYVSVSGNTLTLNTTISGSTAYFFNTGWTKRIPIGDVCQDDSGNSLGKCADSGNFACGTDGTDDNVYTCTPLD